MGLTTEDYDVEGVDLDELWSGVAEVEVEAEAVNQFYAQGDRAAPARRSRPPRPTSSWSCATATTRSTARWGSSARPGRPTCPSSSSPRRGSGASGRATRSSPSRSTCSSTTRSGWSPSWARPAPARRCSPSPPASTRPWRSRPTRSCSSPGRSSRSGGTSATCPGDVEEKLNPWMQPIFDNVEYLMNLSRSEKKLGRGYHELVDLGILEIEPLTYIRGRSIPNQFMIVDEAQNLTPHEVKTIITRVGDGTKIVLTGDPYQIDNPYVDQTNNGLVHVVNRFKQEKLAGPHHHVEGRAVAARRAGGEPALGRRQGGRSRRRREGRRGEPADGPRGPAPRVSRSTTRSRSSASPPRISPPTSGSRRGRGGARAPRSGESTTRPSSAEASTCRSRSSCGSRSEDERLAVLRRPAGRRADRSQYL